MEYTYTPLFVLPFRKAVLPYLNENFALYYHYSESFINAEKFKYNECKNHNYRQNFGITNHSIGHTYCITTITKNLNIK